MKFRHGKQIGVIKFSPDMNIRHWIEREKKDGNVVVIRDGHATIHLPK